MKKYLAVVITALTSLLGMQSAEALAVSDIELSSSLNQQLDARIFLLSATESELHSLKVSVQQAESGTQGNMKLEHEVVEDGERPYIKITSKDAVREPVLNLQIELSWSTGRLLREYSLIIDPQ